MKKIMVVDDEFIVRIGIRGILNWEEHGYTVAADAQDGSEALEKISRCRPDIVLTDLVMKGMDGFELIRRCRERYPEIRFVVLSSYNDFDNVRGAMKLGARDYIFKPTMRAEDLLRVLDELSGDAESRREEMNTAVVRENLQVIKAHFFQRWVDGLITAPEEIRARFQTLAPAVDLSAPYAALYVGIDDFERRALAGDLGDLALVKASMENIVYEVFGTGVEVFDFKKSDLVVLLNESHDVSGDGARVREDFSRFREYCARYLGFRVSGTLSPAMTGTGKLPGIIRVCEDTMRWRTDAAAFWPYNGGQRNEIARARDYIDGHITERLAVRDVALAVGMSESYFSHLFKKETGVPVIEYINRRKMETAAALLENHALKVADVAGRLGLDNANYFSVLFKKIMGSTPKEYRRRASAAPGAKAE